jgi:hypothetical protein
MKKGSQKKDQKNKAINWLYSIMNDDKVNIIQVVSLNQFKEENIFFLDEYSSESILLEYNAFNLYSLCRKMQLPITRIEVINYLKER